MLTVIPNQETRERDGSAYKRAVFWVLGILCPAVNHGDWKLVADPNQHFPQLLPLLGAKTLPDQMVLQELPL